MPLGDPDSILPSPSQYPLRGTRREEEGAQRGTVCTHKKVNPHVLVVLRDPRRLFYTEPEIESQEMGYKAIE